MRKTVLERLYDGFIAEPNSGCWLWMKGLNSKGYGQLRHRGRMRYVHRVSWELHNGPIPDGDDYHGVCVLHRCDTPSCVNPTHLFLGTHADNMVDKSNKGRSFRPRGERHGESKLTAEQVMDIRADPRILREIAAQYGIHLSLVSTIKRGLAWKHLPMPGGS